MGESSTSQTTTNTSSSAQTNELQAWAQETIANAGKPKTVGQIKAAGDVKVRLGILWIVGILCAILSSVGGYLFIITPEHAIDFWVIIGPIITAGMTGPIHFIAGDKSGSSK